MGGKRIAVAASIVLSLGGVAVADDQLEHQVDTSGGELSPSYLVDGGAIPFIWAPLAARIALDEYTKPRDEPLAFSASEGGATKADWEIPGYAVTALGGVSAIGMIASGDRSRYYHVKGMAEALSTGCLVTGLAKVAFGRHRPDWDPDVNSDTSRRSFPSGHSTQAFAIATYSILYLRGHVFAKHRGNRALPWWEAATYGGIALGASALAGERVMHHKHHLTDVAVGALVGTATSTAFYIYQEGRYDSHVAESKRANLTVAPTQGQGATVGVWWLW